jgi:excinuclease UvrABC nuclease subunit
VTADLFKKYPSAKDYAEANLAKLEEEIRPTGFYRNKAKSIQKCCQELVKQFGGEVPRTLEELVSFYHQSWEKNWNEMVRIVRKEYSAEDYRRFAGRRAKMSCAKRSTGRCFSKDGSPVWAGPES